MTSLASAAAFPVMAETFAATSPFPGAHLPVAQAGSVTTASAYDSHPANPQAPQFAPGRQARTASILGSTLTANFFAAYARANPQTMPNTANTINPANAVVQRFSIFLHLEISS